MEKIDHENIEQKKKYLKRYKRMTAVISRLEDKLARLDDRLYKIKSPNFSGEPRGGTHASMEELLSDKIELEKRINHLVKKSKGIRSEILEKIDELDDPRYAEILEAFFIDCKDFNTIADETGYTLRHVMRLYAEALRLISL